ASLRAWPATSWKKYFAAYLVETQRWFVYPYAAYSTNCAEPGAHVKASSHSYQVHLANPSRCPPSFEFSPAIRPDVCYDSFMEPCGEFVYKALRMERSSVEIDL